MSKVFCKVLWIKYATNLRPARQAEPSDLKRPNHPNTLTFSYHFFSSNHGEILTAVALATPVPRSGN